MTLAGTLDGNLSRIQRSQYNPLFAYPGGIRHGHC
jgi:hypothetical protein